MTHVKQALVSGATQLLALPPTAPPAFLLDASRLAAPSVSSRVARYDNRWVVRLTDFPSPSKLSGAGIRRALLIRSTSERPAPDLEAVLLEWQQRGIELWRLATSDSQSPQRFQSSRDAGTCASGLGSSVVRGCAVGMARTAASGRRAADATKTTRADAP